MIKHYERLFITFTERGDIYFWGFTQKELTEIIRSHTGLDNFFSNKEYQEIRLTRDNLERIRKFALETEHMLFAKKL